MFLSSCPAGDLIKGGIGLKETVRWWWRGFFDKISYEKTRILLLMVQIPNNRLLDV